jgi:drug/metabolite transporter (DMT)-like permease
VTEFSGEDGAGIRSETLRDLIDCVLGIAFCTAAILAVISQFGKHWGVFAVARTTTVVAGGALDMIANLLYLVATRSGPLSIVVTLASLYPASTVLLARVVLHERLSRLQWLGVICAMVAVIMIVR